MGNTLGDRWQARMRVRWACCAADRVLGGAHATKRMGLALWMTCMNFRSCDVESLRLARGVGMGEGRVHAMCGGIPRTLSGVVEYRGGDGEVLTYCCGKLGKFLYLSTHRELFRGGGNGELELRFSRDQTYGAYYMVS